MHIIKKTIIKHSETSHRRSISRLRLGLNAKITNEYISAHLTELTNF